MPLADREDAEGIHVPSEHLLHPLDHGRHPIFGGTTRWSEHPQRLVPATRPPTEHEEVGQGAEVIDVQVRDEDLVEFVEREPCCDVVRNGSLAEVEDEVLAVAKLYQDRGVHLAGLGSALRLRLAHRIP